MMTPQKRVPLHLAIWLAVFAFWFLMTRQFHPTTTLAILATSVLVTSSAVAVYVNQLSLIPRLARASRWWQYVVALLVTVLILALICASLIAFLYDWIWGPDPRRFGLGFNLLSDGIIIVLHVVGAIVVRWISGRLR